MKKLLSLFLALTVLATLPLSAAAATSADQRLSAVTTQVKQALDLNTDAYTEFYGDLDDDPLSPTWYLNWMGNGISLSIRANEDGKVLSYNASDEMNVSVPSGKFAPSFPAGSRESAKAVALDFLNKTLGEGESILLDESRGSSLNLNTTRYRFYGEILVNGLSIGLSFSIAVRCEDNMILSFWRDDLGGSLLGSIPSPKAAITADHATQALRETLKLRLEYALSDDGSHAVLRYLPEGSDEYYADAASGELVNLSELFRDASKGEFGDLTTEGTANDTAAAPESPMEPSLSPAEQEGIEKLEGVLDRDALDAKARAITALGLNNYNLATVSYTVDQQTNKDAENVPAPVTASLRYGRQVEGFAWRRTVTLDARTGELLSLSSSGRLPEGMQRTVDQNKAQKTAETFLTSQTGTQFAKTALYNSYIAEGNYSLSHSFTYAQKENGYFYPGNTIRVGVDSIDGSISSYYKNFNDSVTFDSPEGIITADAAIDAWLDTYETTLLYVLVPAAIDFSLPEYAPLTGLGYDYLYRPVLGYQLEREDYMTGIDAKTALPVVPVWTTQEDNGLSYNDLDGHWAKDEIGTLALYGVGYHEDSFRPEETLTQIDLVALLASTEGYRYQPEAENAADALYQWAWGRGLLPAGERKDDTQLTRIQALKLILDATDYGHIAQLEGIFCTSFADDAEIPSALYGYAALGQGLGVVGGSTGNMLCPNAPTKRCEGAVMLYNLMSR